MNHHFCKTQIVSCLGVIFLFLAGHHTNGEQPCQKPQIKADGEYIEAIVYEGVGFAGLEFGDTKEYSELILGEPTGGCNWSRKFMNHRVSINYCSNSAGGFHFYQGFKGTLSKSGIGIGNTLEQVIDYYGEYKNERSVKNLSSWHIDRVLLIVKETREDEAQDYAKLRYGKQAVYFVFNEDFIIIEFGLTRRIEKTPDKSNE